MLYSQSIRRLIARSFMVLFALMLLNGIVFRHAHKLSNGKIITHAHPYQSTDDAPLQPNHHTEKELYLLDLLANGSFIEAPQGVVLSVSVVSFVLFQVIVSSYSAYFSSRQSECLSLRGPPVLG